MLQLAFRIAIPGFATSVTHVHVMFDLLAFIAHSKHMANVNIFAMNNPGSLVQDLKVSFTFGNLGINSFDICSFFLLLPNVDAFFQRDDRKLVLLEFGIDARQTA
jgi:hypothetical protein